MICVDYATKATDGNYWAHLFDDEGDVDMLHAFAARIGLRRDWFQDNERLPHYDVRASKLQMALATGARQVDREFVVEVLTQQRQGGNRHGSI